VDIKCRGGIRLYAIPIRAGGEIVGSMNFGYGDPPKDQHKLQEIAERYGVSVDRLLELGRSYRTRPPFIIDVAKRRLVTSAWLIGEIVERKRAEENLRQYQHQLEELVQTRTAELSQANEQLLQEIEQRKHLERDILNISETEHRRIGQELHDSLGQQLTGIAIMSKVLEQKLNRKSLAESVEVQEITKLVNQAAEQTRGLAKGLHPVDLDASGLVSALHELAATTEQVFDICCTFNCDESVPIYDATVAVHLYRIAQEAVTNAVKHGRAENIVIGLAPDTDMLILTIKSDGLDFPEVLPKSKGIGLQIMNYRAEMIDGALDVRRGAEGGTIVTCTFLNKKT